MTVLFEFEMMSNINILYSTFSILIYFICKLVCFERKDDE